MESKCHSDVHEASTRSGEVADLPGVVRDVLADAIASSVAVPPPANVLRAIRSDSRAAPKAYLDECETPFGGE